MDNSADERARQRGGNPQKTSLARSICSASLSSFCLSFSFYSLTVVPSGSVTTSAVFGAAAVFLATGGTILYGDRSCRVGNRRDRKNEKSEQKITFSPNLLVTHSSNHGRVPPLPRLFCPRRSGSKDQASYRGYNGENKRNANSTSSQCVNQLRCKEAALFVWSRRRPRRPRRFLSTSLLERLRPLAVRCRNLRKLGESRRTHHGSSRATGETAGFRVRSSGAGGGGARRLAAGHGFLGKGGCNERRRRRRRSSGRRRQPPCLLGDQECFLEARAGGSSRSLHGSARPAPRGGSRQRQHCWWR
mgnify:CR=1 FL=1